MTPEERKILRSMRGGLNLAQMEKALDRCLGALDLAEQMGVMRAGRVRALEGEIGRLQERIAELEAAAECRDQERIVNEGRLSSDQQDQQMRSRVWRQARGIP